LAAASLYAAPAHAAQLKSPSKPKGGGWRRIIWEKAGDKWVCRLQEKRCERTFLLI
jgi:hypothetical protein